MESDREWFLRRLAEKKETRKAQLTAAKKEAARRGKEPFDFDRLCEMYDPTSDLAPADREIDPSIPPRYEEKYYLDYRDVLTLEDFAARLNELDVFIP